MFVSPFAAVRLLGFAGCCWLAGCTGGDGGFAPVTGRVVYRQQPLANAQVNFTPVAGGRIASGQTDADGRFQLGTNTLDDGALIGKHKVSVIARGPDRPLRPGEVGSGLPGDRMPGDPLIPAKYFDPQTSKIELEVVRGNNDFPVTLE